MLQNRKNYQILKYKTLVTQYNCKILDRLYNNHYYYYNYKTTTNSFHGCYSRTILSWWANTKFIKLWGYQSDFNILTFIIYHNQSIKQSKQIYIMSYVANKLEQHRETATGIEYSHSLYTVTQSFVKICLKVLGSSADLQWHQWDLIWHNKTTRTANNMRHSVSE